LASSGRPLVKSRKELKDEYKLKATEMGVFQIRNLTNGKVFVGSTTTLGTIWNSQKFQLELGGHPNKELQAEWNAMGVDAFVFEVLHTLKPNEESSQNPREEVRALEQMTIEELQPFGENGYHRAK
jgi:hypothetical protein